MCILCCCAPLAAASCAVDWDSHVIALCRLCHRPCLVRTSRVSRRCTSRTCWGKQIADCDVLEADSTTDAKWSRHLVVHIPDRAFASAVAAGHFVKQHVLQHPDAQQLDVATASTAGGREQQCCSFVDDSVYTKCGECHDVGLQSEQGASLQASQVGDCMRCSSHVLFHTPHAANPDRSIIYEAHAPCRNRLFRCLHSSKCGKPAQLKLTGRYPPNACDQPQQALWLQSLACNVAPGAQTLHVPAAAATAAVRARALAGGHTPVCAPVHEQCAPAASEACVLQSQASAHRVHVKGTPAGGANTQQTGATTAAGTAVGSAGEGKLQRAHVQECLVCPAHPQRACKALLATQKAACPAQPAHSRMPIHRHLGCIVFYFSSW